MISNTFSLKTFLCSFCVWAASTAIVHAQDSTNGTSTKVEQLAGKNPTQIMMQNKLMHMNHLFAATIAGDFDAARRSTQLLETISRASDLQNSKRKDFASHALTFQNSTGYMLEQIAAKNRDGMTLGYVRLTMACSYCHNDVRGDRAASPR